MPQPKPHPLPISQSPGNHSRVSIKVDRVWCCTVHHICFDVSQQKHATYNLCFPTPGIIMDGLKHILSDLHNIK